MFTRNALTKGRPARLVVDRGLGRAPTTVPFWLSALASCTALAAFGWKPLEAIAADRFGEAGLLVAVLSAVVGAVAAYAYALSKSVYGTAGRGLLASLVMLVAAMLVLALSGGVAAGLGQIDSLPSIITVVILAAMAYLLVKIVKP